MKKDNTQGRSLWPWKALIGGACLAVSAVIAFGLRGLDNPDGWPEWMFFPGVALAIVGGVLIYTHCKEGSL